MPKQANPADKFAWITNRSGEAYVTVDSQMRLYISAAARDLLDVPYNAHFRLIAGYDFANHRIVLAKPEVVRVPNVRPFNFDRRAYSKAKAFVEKAGLGRNLPARFYYVGKDYSEYPRGAHVFTLEDYEAEDV